LYQDIATQKPEALMHRDGVKYDLNLHEVHFKPNSKLSNLLGGVSQAKVNSIHHQGVKDLAANFVVEAYCPHDQIPEAIRFEGNAYIAAVQWHPEFHTSALGTLDDSPILTDFLNAALSKQSV
jgi:putative glutamine amidotransferase